MPWSAAGVVGEGGGGVAVELNSETALPLHWEQCLDMQTGEVYYFNREIGTRTSKDPRAAAAAAHAYSSSYLSEEEDVSSPSDSFSSVRDSVDSTTNSCLTSISSASSPATAAESLVSAGCRSCFTYQVRRPPLQTRPPRHHLNLFKLPSPPRSSDQSDD